MANIERALYLNRSIKKRIGYITSVGLLALSGCSRSELQSASAQNDILPQPHIVSFRGIKTLREDVNPLNRDVGGYEISKFIGKEFILHARGNADTKQRMLSKAAYEIKMRCGDTVQVEPNSYNATKLYPDFETMLVFSSTNPNCLSELGE